MIEKIIKQAKAMRKDISNRYDQRFAELPINEAGEVIASELLRLNQEHDEELIAVNEWMTLELLKISRGGSEE